MTRPATHSFAYDLALHRLEAAGQDWLDQRCHGQDTTDTVERCRRAFRREERRDRKRLKHADQGGGSIPKSQRAPR